MAKDKAIGFLLFIFGLLVLIYYTWNVLIVAFFHAGWPNILNWFPHISESDIPPSWYWFLAIPIWLAMFLILIIAMWIGWTMFTTPPPVPFEELEKEEEAKEKKKKAKPAKKAKKT
jgi:phosphotransferase system  glucose/maltose/N-acetylglucosamine-specific IIC component